MIVTPQAIETMVYAQLKDYPQSINSWIADLSEIATRAVGRGEKGVARSAAAAIGDLTTHYLTSRKSNLSITSAPGTMFMARESDVDVVVNRAYEALQELSASAAAQSDEGTAIRVSEVYQEIAIHTAHLDGLSFRDGSAPLTYAPLHYAFDCVMRAQTKGLDEVAFQSAGILAKVSEGAPKDIDTSDIHIPVVDGLSKIALYFYGKRGSWAIAEATNRPMFRILAQLLHRQDAGFKEVLRHVLKKMELLALPALANEAINGGHSMTYPLNEAYGLVNANSVAYLVERAARTLPKVDEKRAWVNPYGRFAEVVKVVATHLRSQGESCEFGDSFLIWQIDQSIRKIAKILALLIDQPIRTDHGDEEELVDALRSILSFYWVAFSEKKTVGGQRADECCEALTMIGVTFLNQRRPDVLRTCMSNIWSIVESYCKAEKSIDAYKLADLLAHLWGIRLLLVAMDNQALIEELDKNLDRKPQALSDEQWGRAQEAIMLRREQLGERLEDYQDGYVEAEALLGRSIREAQRVG